MDTITLKKKKKFSEQLTNTIIILISIVYQKITFLHKSV